MSGVTKFKNNNSVLKLGTSTVQQASRQGYFTKEDQETLRLHQEKLVQGKNINPNNLHKAALILHKYIPAAIKRHDENAQRYADEQIAKQKEECSKMTTEEISRNVEYQVNLIIAYRLRRKEITKDDITTEYKNNLRQEVHNAITGQIKYVDTYEMKQNRIKATDKDPGRVYIADRDFQYCSKLYKAVTDNELLKDIKEIHHKNNDKPITIFDEGCGDGEALIGIKKEMGSKVNTIGITLSKSKNLANNEQDIDKILEISSDKLLLKDPFHVFLSCYGGTQYTPLEVKLPLIMKNCYSLNTQNSLALFILDLNRDFVNSPNPERDKEEFLSELEESLEQEGFDFQYKYLPSGSFEGHRTNNDVIVVKPKQ